MTNYPYFSYSVTTQEIPDIKKEDYKIDTQLKNQLDSLFSQIKGDKTTKKSFDGDLNVKSLIDFKLDQKSLKIFDKKIRQKGGTVFLLVDGSGTMRYNKNYRYGSHVLDSRIAQTRDLVSTLFKSLDDISNINFKVIIYNGSFEDPTLLNIVEINSLKDCNKIVCDYNYKFGSTPTHNAIHYVTEKFKDVKGKKLLITLTDGRTELWKDFKSIDNWEYLANETKRAFINAENNGFNIFGIGINLMNTEQFKTIFRQNYVNVKEVIEAKKFLIRNLENFIGDLK